MGIWLLDFSNFGMYLNKTVKVIIIKIYDRDKFLPANTVCVYLPDKRTTVCLHQKSTHRPLEVEILIINHYSFI
jgi:hypothetical protein